MYSFYFLLIWLVSVSRFSKHWFSVVSFTLPVKTLSTVQLQFFNLKPFCHWRPLKKHQSNIKNSLLNWSFRTSEILWYFYLVSLKVYNILRLVTKMLHSCIPPSLPIWAPRMDSNGKSDVTPSSKYYKEKKNILAIPQSTAFARKLNAMRLLL